MFALYIKIPYLLISNVIALLKKSNVMHRLVAIFTGCWTKAYE